LAYRRGREDGASRLFPILVDLAAPSPALGWAHEERSALADRGPADLLLALAIVHHLAISCGLPFEEIARYFARLGRALIIEFVPGSDPQVESLFAGLDDRADGYTQAAFAGHFHIEHSEAIADSARRLYLMVRR
jgi:hypothetical protein